MKDYTLPTDYTLPELILIRNYLKDRVIESNQLVFSEPDKAAILRLPESKVYEDKLEQLETQIDTIILE